MLKKTICSLRSEYGQNNRFQLRLKHRELIECFQHSMKLLTKRRFKLSIQIFPTTSQAAIFSPFSFSQAPKTERFAAKIESKPLERSKN